MGIWDFELIFLLFHIQMFVLYREETLSLSPSTSPSEVLENLRCYGFTKKSWRCLSQGRKSSHSCISVSRYEGGCTAHM